MGPEDQHPWDREDEEIAQAFAAKDAEIERLKEELELERHISGSADAHIGELRKLISELCDALEVIRSAQSGLHYGAGSLIHRAREAAR